MRGLSVTVPAQTTRTTLTRLTSQVLTFEPPLCSSLSHKLTLTAERTDGVGKRRRDEVSRSLARKASSRGHGALSRGVRTPRGS